MFVDNQLSSEICSSNTKLSKLDSSIENCSSCSFSDYFSGEFFFYCFILDFIILFLGLFLETATMVSWKLGIVPPIL